MLLAVKMANALKKKKISQKQFAEMMGKSTTVVSEWLSGDRNFTVDTLTDIGYALGINLLNTESEPELTITDQYSTADVKLSKFVSFRTTVSLTHDGQNYVRTVDKLKVV
jgi:transcriptional regulator with XRE-family HTH domain